MGTRYGTSHFLNKRCANAYYRGYGLTAADVAIKVRDGEIHLGMPAAPAHCPNARIFTDREGRYVIEEPDAAAKPVPSVAQNKPATRTTLALDPIPQRDGFEQRQRGAMTNWHIGNVSGARSRSGNQVEYSEAFSKLDDSMHEAIAAVHEEFAKRYLSALRSMLAPYNTSRHVITIRAGMGASHIDVSGRMISDWEGPRRGLYLLLSEMAQALEWDWANYLDGERLNPTD